MKPLHPHDREQLIEQLVGFAWFFAGYIQGDQPNNPDPAWQSTFAAFRNVCAQLGFDEPIPATPKDPT